MSSCPLSYETVTRSEVDSDDDELDFGVLRWLVGDKDSELVGSTVPVVSFLSSLFSSFLLLVDCGSVESAQATGQKLFDRGR